MWPEHLLDETATEDLAQILEGFTSWLRPPRVTDNGLVVAAYFRGEEVGLFVGTRTDDGYTNVSNV